MKTLSEVIALKVKELGIKNSELARRLGWGKSKTNPGAVIGQYLEGKITPSIEFAIRWKEVFNENLIDLMFDEQIESSEKGPEHESTLVRAMEKTIEIQDVLIKELNRQLDLKNSVPIKGHDKKG